MRISTFDPVYPKPKGRETSRAPKRAEICDSYTVLQLSRPVKRPKLTPLCSPRAVWTPPRGVSTSIFGDSLQEFTQKSETVDMWTSVCLIILKATTVHTPGGGSRAKASQLISTFCCLPPHWGEPFHCPRQGVPYKTVGPVSPKKKKRGDDGRRSKGVSTKSEGQARGKSTAAGSSERHFRLTGTCGRPHYECMQDMKGNLWTASVCRSCKYNVYIAGNATYVFNDIHIYNICIFYIHIYSTVGHRYNETVFHLFTVICIYERMYIYDQLHVPETTKM